MKKELKALKKQNKMLFIIAKNSVSCRKLKNIMNIRAKSSKKRCNYSSDSSSDDSDYDSSLSIDSDWDTYSRPYRRKEMNKLDHIVTYNIKTNKDQLNESIYNEPTYDTSIFNSCI